MELKTGYKQTEVGVIPEDWEVQAFKDGYAESSRNGIYKPAEYQGRGTRIVNMGELFALDFISDQEMALVELSPAETSASTLRDGDLLFGRRSVVPSGAGKCSLIVKPSTPLTFESSAIRVRLHEKNLSPLFYYYFFSSPVGKKIMAGIVSGTNVKGIRASELRELKIPRPPLSDQREVEQALNDIDSLIAMLNRQITKKRQIKQAAMQELLTGKRRLPGLEGEWAQVSLGSVAAMNSGGTPPTGRDDFYGGGIPWVSISDMTSSGRFISETERTLSDLGLANCAAKRFPSGTILYAMYASLGECSMAAREVTTSQAILGIRPGPSLSGEYLYYWLDSIRSAVKLMGQQGTQSNLNKKIVQGFILGLPSKHEQAAITKVLSEIDQAIDALRIKAEKTHAVKVGMMQQLLTGKIRLT